MGNHYSKCTHAIRGFAWVAIISDYWKVID